MVLERGPFESWQGLVRAAGVVALLKLPNDPCRRTDAVPPGTGPILGQKKLPVLVARALHCRPPAGQPKSGDRQPALECEVTRHPSIGLWREHIFNVTPHALHKFIRCLNQLLQVGECFPFYHVLELWVHLTKHPAHLFGVWDLFPESFIVRRDHVDELLQVLLGVLGSLAEFFCESLLKANRRKFGSERHDECRPVIKPSREPKQEFGTPLKGRWHDVSEAVLWLDIIQKTEG